MMTSTVLVGLALCSQNSLIVLEPDSLYAKLVYTDDLGHDHRYLSLAFMSVVNGRIIVRQRFPVGITVGAPRLVCSEYFLRRDRRQLFVSAEDRRISSFLLDFDGSKVRVIYQNIDGRVLTFPRFAFSGDAEIDEYWPLNQYRHKLGTPVAPDNNDYVERSVHFHEEQ
jgi:hypothetical protein